MTTNELFLQHDALIKKVAWSFNFTTGISYEELYSEACLAYVEALNSFDDSKMMKLSTYLYSVIESHLINFGKKERLYAKHFMEEQDTPSNTPFYEFFTNVSKDLYNVVSIIFSDEELQKELENNVPKKARGILVRYLKDNCGYSRKNGWELSEKLRKEVTELEVGCIIIK